MAGPHAALPAGRGRSRPETRRSGLRRARPLGTGRIARRAPPGRRTLRGPVPLPRRRLRRLPAAGRRRGGLPGNGEPAWPAGRHHGGLQPHRTADGGLAPQRTSDSRAPAAPRRGRSRRDARRGHPQRHRPGCPGLLGADRPGRRQPDRGRRHRIGPVAGARPGLADTGHRDAAPRAAMAAGGRGPDRGRQEPQLAPVPDADQPGAGGARRPGHRTRPMPRTGGRSATAMSATAGSATTPGTGSTTTTPGASTTRCSG